MQRKRTAHDGFVYFISAGEDGPVKVGRTRNPQARFGGFQTASPVPLRMLTWFRPERGALAYEGLLHKAMRAARVRGEWFSLSRTLHVAAFIDERLTDERLLNEDDSFAAALLAACEVKPEFIAETATECYRRLARQPERSR